MSKLTETTLLPLSLVIIIISTAVTIGVTYQKAEASHTEVEKLKDFQKEIIDRLARIETKQDAILKHK